MLKYSDISRIFHIFEGDPSEREPVADINHFISGRFSACFGGEKSCFGLSGAEKVGGVTGSVPLLCSRTWIGSPGGSARSSLPACPR